MLLPLATHRKRWGVLTLMYRSREEVATQLTSHRSEATRKNPFPSHHCSFIIVPVLPRHCHLVPIHTLVKMTSLSLLHPYSILNHIVKVRLPELAAKSDAVRGMYQPIPDGLESAIEFCQSHVAAWVIELFEAGKL